MTARAEPAALHSLPPAPPSPHSLPHDPFASASGLRPLTERLLAPTPILRAHPRSLRCTLPALRTSLTDTATVSGDRRSSRSRPPPSAALLSSSPPFSACPLPPPLSLQLSCFSAASAHVRGMQRALSFSLLFLVALPLFLSLHPSPPFRALTLESCAWARRRVFRSLVKRQPRPTSYRHAHFSKLKPILIDEVT